MGTQSVTFYSVRLETKAYCLCATQHLCVCVCVHMGCVYGFVCLTTSSGLSATRKYACTHRETELHTRARTRAGSVASVCVCVHMHVRMCYPKPYARPN